MSLLSHDECVEVGLSNLTGPLVAWATGLLAAAKSGGARLEDRGVTASYLKELKSLITLVESNRLDLGKKEPSLPAELMEAQRIQGEALAYREEARQIIKIEFGTCPDIQGKGRPGVRTGGLVANLCREMDCLVAVLREHSPQLSWLGVDEAFIAAGESLIGKLKEAREKLSSAIQALPPALAALCCNKGKVYDLSRKLVRIGQLAFLHEPELAAAFNYSLLRKDPRPGSEVRARRARAVAR